MHRGGHAISAQTEGVPSQGHSFLGEVHGGMESLLCGILGHVNSTGQVALNVPQGHGLPCPFTAAALSAGDIDAAAELAV